MAKLLSEKDAGAIKDFFSQQLVNSVTLRLFLKDPGEGECMYCSETEQIAQEVVELSDKLNLVVHKMTTEEKAKEYNIKYFPALVLEKEEGTDTGVRFYGIPSGYEFGVLIEDLADLSSDKIKLAPDVISQVESVQKDVTIKVFVTPT